MTQVPDLYGTIVQGDWVDYNGHMNVAYYVLIFDRATDAFLEQLGIDESYREATGGSVFVVESHITYQREVLEGARVEVSTRLLNYDAKRLHLFHTMHPADSVEIVATIEIMILHVDLNSRKSSAFPPQVDRKLMETAARHAPLPLPAAAGRKITFSYTA